MHIARWTVDNVVYPAEVFSALPAPDIALRRQQLVCPVCAAPAFFRKAAASGQAACFGARPHVPGCNMAAPVALRIDAEAGAAEDRIQNLGRRIVVDLAFGAAQQVNPEPADGEAHGGRGARRFVGNGPRPDADAHKRLRPLLRTLIEVPAFATSEVEIEIPEQAPLRARQFFVALENAGARAQGMRGYWGMVASAAYDQGDLWLNSGGRAAFSILLRAHIAAEVLKRYRINDLEDLAGAYVLAVGTPTASGWGKPYCVPESAEHVAVILTD